jgi:hypothetical protein
LAEASKTYLTLSQDNSSVALAKSNGNAFTNSVTYSFNARVPITGWSSSVIMSSDAATNVVAARYYTTNTQAINTGNTDVITTWTKVSDTNGAMNATTGVYTVPVSGYYKISAQLVSASTAWTTGTNKYVSMLITGNQSISLAYNNIWSSITTIVPITGSATPDFYKAGDTISLSLNNQTGITFTLVGNNACSISIERISGPAQIAMSENVNGRYYAATATVTGSLSNVTFTTKDFDSHNALSGVTLTIPSPGKYQFNVGVYTGGTLALNGSVTLALLKNGTQKTGTTNVAGGAVTGSMSIELSDIISCLAGDAITVQVSSSGTTPVITASNFNNYFSWARVGN